MRNKILLLLLFVILNCGWSLENKGVGISNKGVNAVTKYDAVAGIPSTLLLHFDGDNDSTTITDSSVNNYTFLALADAKLKTAEKKFGTASLYCDGGGDYIYHNGSSSVFAFGEGDFTIDFWINFSSVAATIIIYEPRGAAGDNSRTPTIYMLSTDKKIKYYVSGAVKITSSTVCTTGQWYHVAVVRSSSVTKMFINGTQEGGDYSDTTNYDQVYTPRPNIGAYYGGSSSMNGYIDEFRIIKGTAAWTTDFTVPTSAYSS